MCQTAKAVSVDLQTKYFYLLSQWTKSGRMCVSGGCLNTHLDGVSELKILIQERTTFDPK